VDKVVIVDEVGSQELGGHGGGPEPMQADAEPMQADAGEVAAGSAGEDLYADALQGIWDVLDEEIQAVAEGGGN
jgi:hypothetical protein